MKTKLLTIALLFLLCGVCWAENATKKYDDLNKQICELLQTPCYRLPVIETVKKDMWIYESKAVYIPAIDTIYVLEGNENEMVIAHELTHSVLAKYAIETPLTKNMQEILAGYMDYLIRTKDKQ